MLEKVTIENYKSIENLSLSLGRVNVFIGENGAGKSNILEAISLASAAQAGKLDNEFLASRGIRVSGPELMRSAFKLGNSSEAIRVSVRFTDGAEASYELTNDNKPYSAWRSELSRSNASGTELSVAAEVIDIIREQANSIDDEFAKKRFFEDVRNKISILIDERSNKHNRKTKHVPDVTPDPAQLQELHEMSERVRDRRERFENFIVYCPENSALRLFEREGQIEPLGVSGEGLFKLLTVMSTSADKQDIRVVKDSLKLISWFDDFKIIKTKNRDQIEIFDQFLGGAKTGFDQRSANEGFLFLAFYFALFASRLTPSFFAVDNIDTSFNPKLCEMVMSRLTTLAELHNKQVLLTTHNPAILDGLDISNPDNRLFIVSRGSAGQTRARRFKMKPTPGGPHRLSELFLRGALGGVPKGF